MASKTDRVIVAYYPSSEDAERAAYGIQAWDRANDDIKLGGVGLLIWQDDKTKTYKLSRADAGKGAKWGLALGAVTGILSGGITLLGGAVVGGAAGAVGAKLFYKDLGLSDDDRAKMEQRLRQGELALVVMASEAEVAPTQAVLKELGGDVENYQVPEEMLTQLEASAGIQDVEALER
jgi:uncharacterized membrane protein